MQQALRIVLAAMLLSLSAACAGGSGGKSPAAGCGLAGVGPLLDHQFVRRLPHDAAAFTQGLVIDGEWLFESTGLYGESTLRRLWLGSGREVDRTTLPDALFGEGLALASGRLYQLTWREGVVRIYRPDDLQLVDTARIDGEGWGLAFDGRHLIQSDGSATLYFRSPDGLRELRRLQVTAAGRPLSGLNELEYANGWLLANVFPTDCVAVIDPAGGAVAGWLDLSELADRARDEGRAVDVTNGMAYAAATGSYYVTGKRWPFMAEIRIPALDTPPAAGRR